MEFLRNPLIRRLFRRRKSHRAPRCGAQKRVLDKQRGYQKMHAALEVDVARGILRPRQRAQLSYLDIKEDAHEEDFDLESSEAEDHLRRRLSDLVLPALAAPVT